MSSTSAVFKDLSFIDPSDMDTSSSAASSPTLPARPLAAEATEEHHLYHFHDGSLTFELDLIKYRIHSSLLARHCGFASTWAEDLRDPSAAGISRPDIDAFLSMIYVATYEYVDLSLSTKSWTSILRLATRWKSDGLRKISTRILASKLSPFDKLLLCRQYDVPGWLAPACAALALRSAPLTMAEAEQLEKADIVRVFLAREAVTKGGVEATEEAVGSWIAGFMSKPDLAAAQRASTPTPTVLLSQRTASEIAVDAAPWEGNRSTFGEGLSNSESESGREVPIPPGAPHHHEPTVISEGISDVPMAKLSASASPSPKATPSPTSDLSTLRQTNPVEDASPAIVVAPAVPVRTADELLRDAYHALLTQNHDEALNSFTVDNVASLAYLIAPSIAGSTPQRPGVYDVKRLQHLLQTIMRRVVTSPGFMPRATQFIASLSKQPPLQGLRLEIVLHDDMQSLSSRWATFRAGGQPAVDHGGVMDDLMTSSRKTYQAQTSHARGFFRTLVRLGVLPATNKYVEMLIQSYPMVPNP
ncbi:unnamed protein product [Peniophora sp. CBMAI 1063]|nr:unnamed protein product [Peniophora sp. CBMAI 1063]